MRMRIGLAVAVLVSTACSPSSIAPASSSPLPSAPLTPAPIASRTVAPTQAPATPSSAAAGGIEVVGTGQLHGTYVWVVGEEVAAQERLAESLYAVPLDGSPAKLVVRRLRPRGVPLFGGQTRGGIVPLRQLSVDGTKLALEQSNLGPAAIDGFAVVDMANGRITQLARGDAQPDLLPAWSPDGSRIAFTRRRTTPGSPDDGLWVINADGSGIRQVRPGSCCAQVTAVYGWTADGIGVAFAVTFEGADYSVANVTTGEVTGPHGQVFGLAPASWRLKAPQFAGAFSEGDKGGEQRIDIAEGSGKAPITVWHEPSDFAKGVPLLLNARWSPVAEEILFIRFAQESKIGRVAASGGPARDVATVGRPTKAEWLPDGRIAYISEAAGSGTAVHITDGTKDTILALPAGVLLTDLGVRTYP